MTVMSVIVLNSAHAGVLAPVDLSIEYCCKSSKTPFVGLVRSLFSAVRWEAPGVDGVISQVHSRALAAHWPDVPAPAIASPLPLSHLILGKDGEPRGWWGAPREVGFVSANEAFPSVTRRSRRLSCFFTGTFPALGSKPPSEACRGPREEQSRRGEERVTARAEAEAGRRLADGSTALGTLQIRSADVHDGRRYAS